MFDVLFYSLALLVVGAAVVAVTARRFNRVVPALLATLTGTAGIYVLLVADVVAAVQLLLYAGGTAVLFRIMARRPELSQALQDNGAIQGLRGFLGLLVAVALGSLLLVVVWTVPQWRDAQPNELFLHQTVPAALGAALPGDGALPLLVTLTAIPLVVVAVAMILRAGTGERQRSKKE